MSLFLIVYPRYTDVMLGVYKDQHLLHSISIPSKRASKDFLIELNHLLHQQDIVLTDLDFIGASRGPAPFTTLRVALTFINGLAYATSIPVIGIDALTTFITEYTQGRYTYTIALLNAFSGDLYYALGSTEGIETGVTVISDLLNKLRLLAGTCLFIGNNVTSLQDVIEKQLGVKAIIPQTLPLEASLSAIASKALEEWHNKKFESQLLPLYLKGHWATVQCP